MMCGRALVIACVTLAAAASARARDPVLDDIIRNVRASYAKQQQPMVIFDVDGTLLDNRTRILQIVKEYADKELKGVRPDAAQKLLALQAPQMKYLLTDTLKDANVTESAVVNNAAVFWSERFFSEPYLKYDTPTPGAVEFVRTLYSSGARIVYLTGRDAQRQLLGTVRSLRDHGFPIGIQGTELIMKPTPKTQDAIFKTRATSYLRHYGTVVAALDNDPKNVNVYRRAFKDAAVLLFEAPHPPNPPPLLNGIHKLANF